MVKRTGFILLIMLVILNVACKTYQYAGIDFETEEKMNAYMNAYKEKRKKEEIEKKATEAKEQKLLQIPESAFTYFAEKIGKEKILDLRLEENKQILTKAYFDQHGNKTVNKYIFENQFEYNRVKEELAQIKKKKYLFFKSENMRISDYDFNEKNYRIVWTGVSLPFPKHTLHFKIINLTGTRIVNESINIGGYYNIINEPKLSISSDKAEGFHERWKSNKTEEYMLLEILKIKDVNSGIKCSALKDTLFDENDDENTINFYIRPTCLSEKWDKLVIRYLETKIVGYYIVDNESIYKNIIK